MDNVQKNYSQNNEQEIILAHFKDKLKEGRLLDIGAYSPDAFSNTRALIDLGWSGVLVEPSPGPFLGLLNYYKTNSKIRLLNAAVTPHGGMSSFYDSGGDALSSTSREHADKWTAGWKVTFSEYDIFTLPLPDLFSSYGYDFNFINLDVEGCSYTLFCHLPFKRLDKTTGICIEHDGYINEIINLADKFSFKVAGMNGENLILTR